MDKKTTILAMLLLLTSQSVVGDCNFTTELDSQEECIGLFECSETVNDLDAIVSHWDCIKPKLVTNCLSSGFCIQQYKSVQTYWLKIKIVNLPDNEHNIFKNTPMLLSDHIVCLYLNGGNINYISIDFYGLTQLSVFDISHNKIESINLLSTQQMEKLIVFNISFNLISVLEKIPYDNHKIVSNINTIDFSHNTISVIPDSYFSKFYNLLHLNMSYNKIESLSVLTFEGLAHLETLHLSNNNIQQIGQSLARFSNLKELTLDNNDLLSIKENNFKMLTSLTKLNLSSNNILLIEDFSFLKMISLKNLQLSDNHIKFIVESMFVDNAALQEVDFSNNQIQNIEPFSFKRTNLTICNFRHNALTDLADKSIFVGLKVSELDLSVSNINTLGEDLFLELHSELRSLNLSFNSISHIHETSFRSLEFLTDLDLSHNKLQNLDFKMCNLLRLAYFNAASNIIRKISENTFQRLKSLLKVNLSNNSIADIEMFSFQDLDSVLSLDLSNNNLPNALFTHIFQGLTHTYDLRIMHSKLTLLQDQAFFSMTSLINLNASFGGIKLLEYNVFNGTNIWSLDLSYNCIENFSVNNSYLKNVREIYLNNNQIAILTNEVFYGLNYLKEIRLNNNNILRIPVDAFRSLHKLSFLDLSSNPDMVLDTSVLSNMTMREVNLRDGWKPFSFNCVINSSIEILDLSSRNIIDISSVQIHKIRNIEILSLNVNQIRSIDRNSFQNLSSLISLDLSCNMISIIKPGSFKGTPEISFLNLHNNNLESLIFGVFDGLLNLQVLNLSSNALQNFQGKIFHGKHRITVICLDDNFISKIDFREIEAAVIKKITIGGNLVPCDSLVAAKKYHFNGIEVTSENLNFHVENMDGISCKGSQIEYSTDYNEQKINGNINDSVKSYQQTDIYDEHGLRTSNNLHTLNNQLDALKSALYFEASCLLIIVCLLLGIIFIFYIKLRKEFMGSYNLGSRKHLTESSIEIEL